MRQDVQGKVDSRAMREVNRSIVLDIIRRGGRVSRTDLARRSSLTKPTVSAIVEDLIARGIVHEVGYGKTVASGGRRARLLEFNDHSAAYLGIRFGESRISVGIADARGEMRATSETSAIRGDASRAMGEALKLVDQVVEASGLPRERLQAVGVTVPGLVDQASGEVVSNTTLEWQNVPIRALAQQELGLPVVVSNVTSAGAIAEGRVGAARGLRSFVWVYVGSGIGAGIIIDGQVFPGSRGFSGEIGHCPIVAGGPTCSCGLKGCLEVFASTPAITNAAKAAMASGEATALSEAPHLDVRAIIQAANAEDALAKRVLTEAGEHLGIGISYLVNLLNPQMVVIGGGTVEGAPQLIESVRASASKHTLNHESVKIVPSALGDQGALMGAVLSAMDLSVRSYRVVATGERVVLD
jgi:N-acetylglucosamine repressor